MQIKITTEKRGEIERIQRDFKKHLSADVILRGTSQAINSTMKRSISKINKEVKKEYNITPKYLKRIAVVKPKASSGSLYAGVHLQHAPVPIIGFKPKEKQGSGVTVSVKRGRAKRLQSAFIATMQSGHVGVFARGRYGKDFMWGNEKTASGKIRITEIKAPSPFAMGLSDTVAPQIQDFMGKEVVRATRGILQSRVDRMTRG